MSASARSMLFAVPMVVAGYFAGGITATSSATRVTTTDKLVFATDTTAAQTTANLSIGRTQLAGCN